MSINIVDVMNNYLVEKSNKYSTEKTESIINMLNKFESDNIISSDKKEYYMNVLKYCNAVDSKYKR